MCSVDANMLLIPLDVAGEHSGGGDDVRVHAGFGTAFGSVGDLVLDAVIEQLHQHRGYSVVFTGMSGLLSHLGLSV